MREHHERPAAGGVELVFQMEQRSKYPCVDKLVDWVAELEESRQVRRRVAECAEKPMTDSLPCYRSAPLDALPNLVLVMLQNIRPEACFKGYSGRLRSELLLQAIDEFVGEILRLIAHAVDDEYANLSHMGRN